MSVKNTAESKAEIMALAKKIDEVRLAKHWTQAHLLREYDQLGTSKVWWACLNGNVDDLNLEETWLPAYRGAWSLIEEDQHRDTPDKEEIYDDLAPVSALAATITPLRNTNSNDRVVILQGEPGSGKTTAARLIVERFPGTCILVEALEIWGDRPVYLFQAILRALGVETFPAGAMECYESMMKLVRPCRRVLLIDESHHLGPHSLNALKMMVNQSRWGFVLLCMPTLWRKLERSSYEEARQLTTNRLAERVKLMCPVERDVERMLARRVPGLEKSVVHAAGKLIAKEAQTHGGLGFVRDCCKRLAEQGEGLTPNDVADTVQKELASR